MGFKTAQVTVGSDRAYEVFTAASGGASMAFFNNSNTITVYIGDAVVTSAIGAPVGPQSWSPGIDLDDGETVYARAASSTADLRVTSNRD